MNRRSFLLMGSLAAVAACGNWGVKYPEAVQGAQNWKVTRVDVNIPTNLTVSEDNVLIPNGDITWWETMGPPRRDVVRGILQEGVAAGASKLNGQQAVVLNIELVRFHGMSPTAQATLNFSGVHNVRFYATVVDAATGAALTEKTLIEADTAAALGNQLSQNRANGITETARVKNTIANTVSGWLGTGTDTRNNFVRLGA